MVQAAGRIAVTNGRLIDGTGAPALSRATVLIEGKKITAVGTDLAIPDQAVVVNADGKTIMPGLVDAHMHHMGLIEHPKIDRIARPAELALIRSIKDCRALLAAGYTTLRDCGGTNGIYLKKAAAEGSLSGLPRIVAAGLLILQTHNSVDDPLLPAACADARTTGHAGPQGRESLICDGVDACIKGTRYAIGFGADFIKTFVSGNYLGPNESSADLQFHFDEIKAIVCTAAQAGKFVTAHSQNCTSTKRAILAGVKTIDHAHGTDDEIAALAKDHHVIFTSSLASIKLILDQEGRAPVWLVERAKHEWEQSIAGYERIRMAGARLAAGSDFNGSPMAPLGNNAVELELLCKYCGYSPMEAIVAATSHGAAACFMGDRTGILEPGMYADLLIVDGDPLSEIAILQDERKIKLVMIEGRIEVDNGSAPSASPV